MIHITYNLHTNNIEFRFPYDPRALQLFKLNFPKREFQKENKNAWVVPVEAGQGLQERIIKFLEEAGGDFDVSERVDIAIELAENWKVENLKLSSAETFDESKTWRMIFDGDLKPAQRATAEYMQRNARGVICGDHPSHEPGLTALAVVEGAQDYPCLLITADGDKINWLSSFRHYTRRRGWILGDELALAQYVKTGESAQLAIVNYGRLTEFLPWIVTIGWKSIIIDKAHHIRNADSDQACIVRDLARDTERHKFMLSQSDFITNPWEAAAQLEVLGRIKDFGGRSGFMSTFCKVTRGKLEVNPDTNIDRALREICYVAHKEEVKK